PLLPERLDNMAFSVAVDGGRVFATLNRNTPPVWPKPTPPPEPGEEPETKEQKKARRAAAQAEQPTKRKDFRLVALDARTGRLLWDAAAGAEIEDVARDGRYVTPPLASGGKVF